MLWTSKVCQHEMGWGYVIGEIVELFEEVVKLDVKGMSDELCDVITCALCAAYNTTGVDLPVFWTKSADSWAARVEVWKKIFADEGYEFHQKYLINGANYKKSEKVRLAIELAIKEQK